MWYRRFQAVRDEEEIKRNDLIAELTHKAEQERIELEAKHEEALDFLVTEKIFSL